MKKFTSLIILLYLLVNPTLFGQVGINTDGSAPDASAGLDVCYTDKGFLPPRMTQAQMRVISSPANGLVVFCTTDNKFYAYIASAYAWKEILYGAGNIIPSCGSAITINHVADTVAPVTKTVTYGTVTNVPGEPSKCWITSNLGADHQASTVNDATEPSAGWYWQFNLKQGYKVEGTTRTPNTIWISSIDENSDWLASNDPCAIELGTGWRLPTSSEWTNVDASWTNWNDPWNSALKMHAAGELNCYSGSLVLKGSYGYYWSSTQEDNTVGLYLYFSSINSDMGDNLKTYGFPARCLRD